MIVSGLDFGSIPANAYYGNGAAPQAGAQVAGAGAKTAYNPATGRTEQVSNWVGGKPQFGGTGSKSPADVVTDIINKGAGAIPDSLKALGQQSTNTLTSTAGVSQPVQQASDQTASYISNLIGSGTGTGGDQAQAFISNLLKGGGAGTAAMAGAVKPTDTSFLGSGAAPVQTQKLTDVDISKYMNPAVTAQYDAILHGNDVMNNATRARMAKAGAFGANMQVAQAQNNESTQRQLSLAGADAYKTAQAAAAGDVAAENSGRQSDRTATMSANSQKLGAELSDSQRALAGGQAINSDALATGNAAWKQYLDKIGMGTQLATGAAGALAALPGTKTLSQQQLGPSELGQQIGGLIGLTGLQAQYSKPSGGGGSVSSQSAPQTDDLTARLRALMSGA